MQASQNSYTWEEIYSSSKMNRIDSVSRGTGDSRVLWNSQKWRGLLSSFRSDLPFLSVGCSRTTRWGYLLSIIHARPYFQVRALLDKEHRPTLPLRSRCSTISVPCSPAPVPPGTPDTNSASFLEENRADMGGLDKRKLGSVTEKHIQRHLNLV